MNGSAKIRATHRQRTAVVYVRQSDPKQVLKHRESGLNQRALQDRLIELGWKTGQILVVDDDQGHSGKSTAGRDGFQKLVADVGLGKVGLVLGYEVSRLSRNCQRSFETGSSAHSILLANSSWRCRERRILRKHHTSPGNRDASCRCNPNYSPLSR